MKKLQESPLSKVVAAVLMLALTFTGAMFGLKAVQAVPYLDRESYQDTTEFYRLCRTFENQIASAFALERQLEAEDLTYVERQQLTRELEQLKQSFDSSATNFRFVVCNDAGKDVAFNLNTGEELPAPVHYARFTLGEPWAEELDEDSYAAVEATAAEDGVTEITMPSPKVLWLT